LGGDLVSGARLPEWRYVVRRTVVSAIIVGILGLAVVGLLNWLGVDACAEDFICLPETR
jgi:hypothetical protein